MGYCASLLSYVVVKIRTSFRVIVPCFLATLNLSWFRDSSVFRAQTAEEYRDQHLFIKEWNALLFSFHAISFRMKPTGVPRLFIAFNSTSSKLLHLNSSIILRLSRTSTYKKKNNEKSKRRKRERGRGRKRKYIGMSYNNSKKLPINFRHASRSSNATPQPRTIRGSTTSALWSFPDSLFTFRHQQRNFDLKFPNGFILWTIAYTNGKLKLSK